MESRVRKPAARELGAKNVAGRAEEQALASVTVKKPDELSRAAGVKRGTAVMAFRSPKDAAKTARALNATGVDATASRPVSFVTFSESQLIRQIKADARAPGSNKRSRRPRNFRKS